YVAALPRAVRPSGDWSTSTAPVTPSKPRSESNAPALGTVLSPVARATPRYRMSSARVLLPEPLGPVIAQSTPSGILAVSIERLFSRAPESSSHLAGLLRARVVVA